MESNQPSQTYEFKLRLLGNEVFAIGISSSSASNKWIALALVQVFCFMTIIGAYGEKIVGFFKMLSS